MIWAGLAVCDWPAVSIHACIKSGVSGWAKMGQDTTPFNNFSKLVTSSLPDIYCDNFSDLLIISHNSPGMRFPDSV
jgi:hypothetical protein